MAQREPTPAKLFAGFLWQIAEFAPVPWGLNRTQNPVGFTARVGSIPTSGTNSLRKSARYAEWALAGECAFGVIVPLLVPVTELALSIFAAASRNAPASTIA